MDAATFNLASAEIRTALRNFADRYTNLCRPAIAGLTLSLNRRRPCDLASRQRKYQEAQFGSWNPDRVHYIANPDLLLPDPTLPEDPNGITGLHDQFLLADPDDQTTPRDKVRPPKSAWTGCSRPRRNR